MLGSKTMKAIIFTLPINAIIAIQAPIINVPTSPGNTFAGYLL